MRVHYFLFWTLISSLLFFSCEEEREELTFEDIPHEFTKVGAQNGPPGLELQLLKNDTYELISTSTGCLVTIIDGKTVGPSFSYCMEGRYQIKNNYLELMPDPYDSLRFDYKNEYHISKHYRIMDFDTICYLVDSQGKKGEFDSNAWALSVASKLSISKLGGLFCLRHDKNANPNKPYHKHRQIDLPFHEELPPKYQSYVQDTIELNVIDVNDNLITERHYGKKFKTYITLTLDKGEKDGILKGVWLHPAKEQTVRRSEFDNLSHSRVTVSKVYPNKCEAHILVNSVKEEEWIKKNAKQYRNKSWRF